MPRGDLGHLRSEHDGNHVVGLLSIFKVCLCKPEFRHGHFPLSYDPEAGGEPDEDGGLLWDEEGGGDVEECDDGGEEAVLEDGAEEETELGSEVTGFDEDSELLEDTTGGGGGSGMVKVSLAVSLNPPRCRVTTAR